MAKKAVTSSPSSNGTIESLGKLQLKVVTEI